LIAYPKQKGMQIPLHCRPRSSGCTCICQHRWPERLQSTGNHLRGFASDQTELERSYLERSGERNRKQTNDKRRVSKNVTTRSNLHILPLKIHVMLGIGAPPALQLKVSSRPSRTVRFSGGDSMTGAEANSDDDDKQSK